MNERKGAESGIEREAVLLYLLFGHGYSRIEMSQQARNMLDRDFPYTEKAQYMIYTESLEVVGHALETLAPPGKAVSSHYVPSVDGKTPVLPILGKLIRR